MSNYKGSIQHENEIPFDEMRGRGALRTVAVVRMSESEELERQAVALCKQYSTLLLMAPPVKAFFKRLAVHLKWKQLENSL